MMKQAFYYGVGILLMRGLSLILLPIFTNYLSVEEYGRLEILMTISNFGTLILGFGLVDTLYRYSGQQEKLSEKKVVASELFGLVFIITILCLSVFTLVGLNVSSLFSGYISLPEYSYLSVALLLEGCIAIPLAWLRMMDNAKAFFYLTTSKVFIQAGLSLYFLNIGYGVEGILLGAAISSVYLAIILIISFLKQVGIAIPGNDFISYLTYGIPVVISGLAGFMLAGLDRWIIADALGESAVGVFAVAAKFALVPVILIQPFTLWWYPKRFQLLNNIEGIEKNAHFAVVGVSLAITASALVALFAPIFIRFTLPVEYHDSATLLPLLLLSVIFKLMSELMNIGCYIGQNSYLQMKINIFASLIGLFFIFILIGSYGLLGVAASILISHIVRAQLFYVVSQKNLTIPYRFKPMKLAMGVFILLVSLGQLVRL